MTASKKIVLLGHFGVGKSSLIRRFVENEFSEDYIVTIGVHISKKIISINETDSASLIIWDIEGHDDVKKARASYLLGTHGFIYVVDLSRPVTFKNLETELSYLNEKFPKIPLKVVGNKKDLVTKQHIEQYSTILTPFIDYFTSAKTGNRVELLFSKLAKELL